MADGTNKVYLDDNGNPVPQSQGKVYLDDSGNPIQSQSAPPPQRSLLQRVGQTLEKWYTTPTQTEVPGNVPGVTQEPEGVTNTPQQTFRRGAVVASAAAVPSVVGGLITAPVATGLGLAGGAGGAYVGGKTGEYVGEKVGTPQLGQDIGSTVGGVVGSAAGLAPSLARNMLTPAIPPGLSPEATEVMQNPSARRAVFQLQRAVKPAGSNTDFVEKAAVAAPDLAQMNEATPIKGAVDTAGTPIKGGIVRPDQRLRFAVDNIGRQQEALWNNERMPQITRHAETPTTTRQAATAGMDPADIAAFEKELGQSIPDNIDLQTADNMRHFAATELNKTNALPADARAQVLAQRPWLRNIDGLKGHLQDSIGSVLTREGEPGIVDFDRRYAGLQEVKNGLQSRINNAETSRATDNATVRGGLGNVGILERLHLTPSAGRLTEKAFTGLSDSTVRPPASQEPTLSKLLPYSTGPDTSGPVDRPGSVFPYPGEPPTPQPMPQVGNLPPVGFEATTPDQLWTGRSTPSAPTWSVPGRSATSESLGTAVELPDIITTPGRPSFPQGTRGLTDAQLRGLPSSVRANLSSPTPKPGTYSPGGRSEAEGEMPMQGPPLPLPPIELSTPPTMPPTPGGGASVEPPSPTDLRSASPAPYSGPERRSIYKNSAYAQPTEGEKLAADIRAARAGTPSKLTEGEVLQSIMRDPQKYAEFRSADSKTQGQMLVKEKNAMARRELVHQ